ncbi:MAG: AAA family ATPase [Phycisphaerae bacterium]
MPFDNTPDPRFFFMTAEHEEALAALKYGVTQQRGFTVVTGAPGSGKTLLGRMLTQSLSGETQTAALSHTPDNAHDLISSLCREFGLRVRDSHSTGELVARLEAMLTERHHESSICVAIIDEAQNLSPDLLEHLRMLANLEVDSAKLLQIILLGQPELGDVLRSPRLNQLRQRIFCSRELKPLARDQTRHYIRHRLRIAGASDIDLFSEEAVDLIYERSGGLPRMINQMADNSLLTAYGASRTRIERQTVAESIDQMMRLQFAPATVESAAYSTGVRAITRDPPNLAASPTAEGGRRVAEDLVQGLDEVTSKASEMAERLNETLRVAARQIGEMNGAERAVESSMCRFELARHAVESTRHAVESTAAQSLARSEQLNETVNEHRKAAKETVKVLSDLCERAARIEEQHVLQTQELVERLLDADERSQRLEHITQQALHTEKACTEKTQSLGECLQKVDECAKGLDDTVERAQHAEHQCATRAVELAVQLQHANASSKEVKRSLASLSHARDGAARTCQTLVERNADIERRFQTLAARQKQLEATMRKVESATQTSRGMVATVVVERSKTEKSIERLHAMSKQIAKTGGETARRSERVVTQSDKARRELIETTDRAVHTLRELRTGDQHTQHKAVAAATECGELKKAINLLRHFAHDATVPCAGLQ